MLYKHFYGYAMGISMRYSLNRDDALEAVNDAFIKAFKSIETYDESRPFKAWLRTIVVNTSIDRRRRELKFQLNTDIDEAPPIKVHAAAVDSLNAQDIMKMMKTLPALQLAIFNLYEIDGYSHDEIADMLDIPASSSRVYLSRAKERLRKVLTTDKQKHG